MYERLIFAMGMPRSGTSWLSQIIDSSPDVRFRLSPLFSYAFKGQLGETSPREEYDRVFRGAYQLDDEFMTQRRHRQAENYPTFAVKSPAPRYLFIKDTRYHNLIETLLRYYDDMKMVCIVRHPCGTISSWLNTPKEFPRTADPAQEWRHARCRKTAPEEFWGFEDWKTVTRLHMRMAQEYPERVRLLRYESLVVNAVEETRALFSFLGLTYTAQTEAFVVESQGKHVDDTHAVYKHPRVKDRWRDQLPRPIQEEILAEVRGTNLERFIE